MRARDFCYWLQGYFEINAERGGAQASILGPEQVECIRRHLAMVFVHEIDPSMGDQVEQVKLNEIHEALKKQEETNKILGEKLVEHVGSPHAGRPPVMRC